MIEYLRALRYVRENGVLKENRTGVRTLSTFGVPMQFDFSDGFPILTTKRMPFKSITAELIGFIRGYDNAADFRKLGTKIWDANANSDYWQSNPLCRGTDDLGRIYGVQWRYWRSPWDSASIDQLQNVMISLINDPDSRRHVVTAWNPGEIHMSALPPCHMIYQFWVGDNDDLHLCMFQRSCDMFLGVPFNITSYALLLAVMANVTGLRPASLSIMLGDAHIYENHINQVDTQLERTPRLRPVLRMVSLSHFDFFKMEDATLVDYSADDPIQADMVV